MVNGLVAGWCLVPPAQIIDFFALPPAFHPTPPPPFSSSLHYSFAYLPAFPPPWSFKVRSTEFVLK